MGNMLLILQKLLCTEYVSAIYFLFKENGYTSREGNSVKNVFLSSLSLLQNERSISQGSRVFPFQIDLFSEGFLESNQEVTEVVFHCKSWKKIYQVLLISLNLYLLNLNHA